MFRHLFVLCLWLNSFLFLCLLFFFYSFLWNLLLIFKHLQFLVWLYLWLWVISLISKYMEVLWWPLHIHRCQCELQNHHSLKCFEICFYSNFIFHLCTKIYVCAHHLVSFRVDLEFQRPNSVILAKWEMCIHYHVWSLEHFHHLKSWHLPICSSSQLQGPVSHREPLDGWAVVLLCKFASDVSYLISTHGCT